MTLAIGYDGRGDVVTAVRSVLAAHADEGVGLRELAEVVDTDMIGAALPGGPVKDIDLVIRTSGELRISGFFPWQSAHAELYFSARMWPAFGEADFEDALAHFARVRRQR